MIEPLGLVGALLEESSAMAGDPKFPGGASLYPKGGTVTLPTAPLVELFARRGRTTDFSGALYSATRSAGVALADNDVVRVKIGRSNGRDVDLDLKSGDSTTNGSGVTVVSRESPASIVIRLAQGDLAELPPGVYLGEVSVVDSSESSPSNAIKFTQEFILHVIRALTGDLGL
jgi:hypothetical protein